MQPGRARTSRHRVPPLLLVRCIGWVAPLRPTHGVLVLSLPSAPLRVHICTVSWDTWLLFTAVPPLYVVLCVRCPGSLGSCSPMCSLDALCCVCGVLGHLAPVHRCARSLCSVACAASWATSLLFTGVPAPSVALLVRSPGPLGSCSPVSLLGVLHCVCGVLGHLAPVHRCARSVRCFACAVSWATWLLFTSVPAGCVVLRLRCPGPLGSCSPMCALCPLLCVCRVLGHLAPVHRCASSVRCFACAVSWATWLLFTGVPARCVVFRVRCPGPPGSCSPVCPFGALLCMCGVLGQLAPAHRCARVVCCVACPVFRATGLLFTRAPAPCVAMLLQCPGPLGSCSPVCPPRVLCCVRAVLGQLASVHRCARSVCCVECAVSWATWLLFTGVRGPSFAVIVRCPRPLGSCSPVCPLILLCGVVRVRCCLCGASLRGAHSCIRTAALCSRLALDTLRARTSPHGRGCLVNGRGWVRCQARNRPPGRRLVLLGTCLPAVDHCLLFALRVSSTRRPLLLGTCPCALFVPVSRLCGVPPGPAWCAVPAPVWSLPVLQSAFPTPWCLSPPRGLHPRLYWVAARGTCWPAENQAHCACRWAPPRQGRWACSASYLFGVRRWGCPWLVSPSPVSGCAHCGGWRLWTRSLTCPVSRTVRRSTGDSAGAPGLFLVDPNTSPEKVS